MESTFNEDTGERKRIMKRVFYGAIFLHKTSKDTVLMLFLEGQLFLKGVNNRNDLAPPCGSLLKLDVDFKRKVLE